MKIGAIRTGVKNLRAGIPGLVSILLFDRRRNHLLYGESDDITSPIREISSCYAMLANKLEEAHACRKAHIGRSLKGLNILLPRMSVSMRMLSEKNTVVGECMGHKGLWIFVGRVSSLLKTLMEAENG